MTPADVPDGDPASTADDPIFRAPPRTEAPSVDMMQVLAARRRSRQARPATDWDALVAAAQSHADDAKAPQPHPHTEDAGVRVAEDAGRQVDEDVAEPRVTATRRLSWATAATAEPAAAAVGAPGADTGPLHRLPWGAVPAAPVMEPEADAEPEPVSEQESAAAAEPESGPEPEPELQVVPEAEPEPEPLSEREPEPEPEHRTALVAEPEPQPEPAHEQAPEPEPHSAPSPAAEREPLPEPAPGPEPDVAVGPQVPVTASAAPAGDVDTPARALSWLTAALADESDTAVIEGTPTVEAEPLLAPAPHRRRRGLVATATSVGIVVVLIIAYAAATLLWPVDGIKPTVSTTAVHAAAAPPATVVWPHDGTAGITVAGMGPGLASSTQAQTLASISKVVTVLMVLDKAPLKLGEQGPSYDFTFADRLSYWGYLARNESALNVPVNGSLTEYQMLQGALIASASNYVARLAQPYWPTDQDFAAASTAWLKAHHISGITLANPTGFDQDNVATPAGLLQLADLAMKNPVVAQIVAQKTATLPGAGDIENTNELLGDQGVVGIKTGTLSGYDVLAAKNVTVDGVPLRMDVSVQNQNTSQNRWIVARGLFNQVEKQLKPVVAVPGGTEVATVTLPWGARASLKTTKDANVVLWNGATAQTATTLKLGDHRNAGDTVGTLSAKGPVNASTVDVTLSGNLPGPDGWWRLTHPFALFGGD